MTDVIIVGAGGHAAEINEYIHYNHRIRGQRDLNIIGFLDDNPDNYGRYSFSAPLLGEASSHPVIAGQVYIIAIAGLYVRRSFVEKYTAAGARFVSVIHGGAYISESAVIGEGSIIGPNVSIGPNVKIGNYCLINARCSLGHDTILGNYNCLSPNACLSGFTKVGDDNLFGINSATLPGITLGNRNKIMAGMIIDTNVGDDTTIFFRFKEKVIAIPR